MKFILDIIFKNLKIGIWSGLEQEKLDNFLQIF